MKYILIWSNGIFPVVEVKLKGETQINNGVEKIF